LWLYCVFANFESCNGIGRFIELGKFKHKTFDALGNATSSYFDKEGRLIRLVEPSYDGDTP